nr:paraquat-inducible protein A [Psychromonas sp. SR45-3]
MSISIITIEYNLYQTIQEITLLDARIWKVAMLIVTVKLGVIASIQVHAGLYLFGIAVLLLMFITSNVSKLKLKKTDDENEIQRDDYIIKE